MGSFNETCALSGLNIPYGTPVRLLLLTQNPYVVTASHEAKRGVYHYDNWFCRSPPLKGAYDDYGTTVLDKSPLVKLVTDVLSEDVVERPFGFNPYHDPPVRKGEDLKHYLEAAWEGRLLVHDRGYDAGPKPPAGWPTWEGVTEILRAARLPVQTGEKSAGYNAQQVRPGVVCVTFNSYTGARKKLEKVVPLLAKDYDCRLPEDDPDRKWIDEPWVVVAPKGALKNPRLLADVEQIRFALDTHPETAGLSRVRQLPTLAVMVREDVWRAYCEVPLGKDLSDKRPVRTVKNIRAEVNKIYEQQIGARRQMDGGWDKAAVLRAYEVIGSVAYRGLFVDIPFQAGIPKHLAHAVEHEFRYKKELLQACAELARVEIVMARLHRPWYIPPTGGQDPEWELHTNLLGRIHAVAEKQRKRYEEE